MPRLSTNLLPTTTTPMIPGTPEDVTGEKYKGDGFYGYSDGLHTVAHYMTDVEGTVRVQGALTDDPVEADWVTLDERIGTAAPNAGYAEALLTPAPANTVAPFGAGAVTYDFNVTIDGGAVQALSFTTVGSEDYDALALLMDAQVVGGGVTFVNGAFRVTSNVTGAVSAATIANGSAGSGGGDLFLALVTAAVPANTSFPTPVAGTTGPLTENATYNFTGNFVWIRATVTNFEQGTITKIQLNH